jgi:hypothetical protein
MLAVIGAVGQAEREAMLERQRDGIAKAKGRYKGRVPTVIGCLARRTPAARWRLYCRLARHRALSPAPYFTTRAHARIWRRWAVH